MNKIACVAGVLALTCAAHADDLDLRAPMRLGYVYTHITRAPEVSVAWGAEADVTHISKNLTFQLVLDVDTSTRPELPDSDPVSAFTLLAVGAGLHFVSDGNVALGFSVTSGITFDAAQLVGGGFAVRAYVYPFYLRIEELTGSPQRFTTLVASSLAMWLMGRVEWTGDGNGATVGFGVSLDLVRFFILPYVDALKKKFR